MKNKFRAMVSILLFLCLIIVFITAIAIHVVESMVAPEILADLILNPEKQDSYPLAELLDFVTGVHVNVGFLFFVLSILHIAYNWKALKSYLTKRKNKK